MITQVALIVTAVKFLLLPLYRSTDFEVHRNWLAITHNKSIDQWYFESTSEWTLDYPPFFAWMEWGLSLIAKQFDPEMVKIENLNYASDVTVLFQRFSVIALDLIYIYSVKKCSDLLDSGKLLVYIILVSNPGLLMVDHIHFQYNGFLYGFLLLSMAHLIKGNFIQGALWFAILMNFKHIFIYIAPVYVVFLLRAYCFTVSSNDGVHTPWYSFSFINLSKLALIVISVFAISFGPFIHQLPQLFSRLFPFKRGLCHAYWAPNFWALYNFGDKILHVLFKKFGLASSSNVAVMTGGLVQEFEHSVLPSIKPNITFILTLLSMLPALIKLWHLGADRRYRSMSFIRCIVICATCSFMFGWHVHEKAILMILIPLSFMSVLGEDDGKYYLLLSTVGHYSLFPLLYPKNLASIKIFLLLTHCTLGFVNIPSLYEDSKSKKHKRRAFLHLPMMNCIETLYLSGLILVYVYENMVHSFLGYNKSLPFLPLMMTSVYCSIGVFYFWLSYYYYFLTFNLSKVSTLVTPRMLQFHKKTKDN